MNKTIKGKGVDVNQAIAILNKRILSLEQQISDGWNIIGKPSLNYPWIDLNTPPIGKRVLVADENKHVCISKLIKDEFDNSKFIWFDDDGVVYLFDSIVAWKELPEYIEKNI